jgi:hypothetical protein
MRFFTLILSNEREGKMDNDEMEIKEVSALFGRAVFFIQCFECQLAITLSTVCLKDPDILTRDQYNGPRKLDRGIR